MKRLFIVGLALAACAISAGRSLQAQDGGLEAVKVRANFYMIAGAGGNIGVQIGSDGVILVNSGNGLATNDVLAALKKVTDLPIRYIINTGAGPDFVGGNAKLAKTGLNVLNGQTGAAI